MKTKAPARNREQIKRDTMPLSVATDLLCQSPRLTNRERKEFQGHRAKVYQSTLTAKPLEERLAKRMASSNWEQLHKWLRRTAVKREDHQREYLRIPDRKLPQPIAEKLIAALELRVAQLDILRDAIENEIKTRQDMCQSNANVPNTPTVTQKPERNHATI
jgi:hypothetical protein